MSTAGQPGGRQVGFIQDKLNENPSAQLVIAQDGDNPGLRFAINYIGLEHPAENPDLKIIFSVSPIRHLRQGVVENQRSKATLVLAIEQILSDLPDSCYFPAYELLLDDLRDYRFYTDDMIHPSTVAQDYIWKFFSTMFFSESTQVINERIKRIVTASQHRPFHADTPLHQQFLSTQLKAIDDLRQTNPHLDFSRESSLFESGMVK